MTIKLLLRQKVYRILEANTTMKPVVDWLTICAHLGIDISSISSEPEVTMKLLEVERWIPFT